MTSLSDIEARAKRYAEARERLAGIVAALNEGIEALKRAEMPRLKKAVAAAAEQYDALQALIADAPELFVRPKTLTLHGIRIGYMKGKGGIVWDDPAAVVAAIEKHLPDQAEALIRWTAKPLKEALNQLDVATLRKIGCRVVDTGEQVVIKPVDGEVDKLVDALLRDAVEDVTA
jgi:arsenate reductase-like glutaredoxin family protein